MIIAQYFPESGLGDRLMCLYIYSIFGRVYNTNVKIFWPQLSEYGVSLASYSVVDTKLSSVLSVFKFPEYLEILDEACTITLTNNDMILKPITGFNTSVNNLYTAFFKDIIPYSQFQEAVISVQKNFKFNVPDYKSNIPYVSVHLRRTDKLRGNDIYDISLNFLDELDKYTKNAILKAKEKGYKYFFLASDDKNTIEQYKQFLLENDLISIKPHNEYNLYDSYYDLWAMKSSALVIQSMKFSTFSLLLPVIWNVPMWTVLVDSPIFTYDFHSTSPIVYYEYDS
jgi:hypothetical protein